MEIEAADDEEERDAMGHPDADGAANPFVSSSINISSRKRAKYTKTFPMILANDESVRYFSASLDTNLFDTASEVEQVLAEIAQKELNNNNNNAKNDNDSTTNAMTSSLSFLGGSLTLGRWTDARQDGLRYKLRLCPFYNTCGCTWRVKVCHNTKIDKYFIVLPILEHQTHLHHFNKNNNKKKMPSKKQQLKQQGTVSTVPHAVQQHNTAASSDTENITKTPQPLPRNQVHGEKNGTLTQLPLSQAVQRSVLLLDSENTTSTESGQQHHVVPLTDRASSIETMTVVLQAEEEEEAAATTNLNNDQTQQEEMCRATTDTNDDGSLQTKMTPVQTAATAAAAAAAAAAALPSIDDSSQLAQLSSMTLLGIDTGDLKLIQDFSKECCNGTVAANITNVATDPLFAAQQATTPAASSEMQNANMNQNMDSKNSDCSLTMYTQMLDSTVSYAQNEKLLSKSETIAMAMDRLAVHLGKNAISQTILAPKVAGNGGGEVVVVAANDYMISTRVDPRLAFDTAAMIHRGHCISQLYQSVGIGKEHVLIQLAATWEGIMAAFELETRHGIHCQLMLIFSTVQAYACAQYSVHVISPHPSDISAYYRHAAAAARSSGTAAANHVNNGSVGDMMDKPTTTEDEFLSINSEGVMACREIYHHFCRHGYDTICMPLIGTMNAGEQKNNDNGNNDGDDNDCLNEIRALAGLDRMIIPIPLMRKLAMCHEPLKQQLHPPANRNTDNNNKTTTTTTTKATTAAARTPPAVVAKNKQLVAAAKTRRMTEQEFRYRLNMDACGTELLARGIRAWIKDVEKLEKIITTRVQEAQKKHDDNKR